MNEDNATEVAQIITGVLMLVGLGTTLLGFVALVRWVF